MMSVYEFGARLIETQDLDPVYVGLHGAGLPRDQLRRWLTAYWMFYHVGAASWLSEQEGDLYWTWMTHAAANDEAVRPAPVGGRWPRAAERRHFRGPKCVKAVEWFSQNPPEGWVSELTCFSTQKGVMDEVQRWPMHGPWIAFKAADMLERVVGVPLEIQPDIGLVYSEPRKTLDMLAQEHRTTPEAVYQALSGHFKAWQAPPRYERACGPLEIETVSCKFHSYHNGRYPIGKDIKEVRHALVGWGETAQRLLAHMPEEVDNGSS